MEEKILNIGIVVFCVIIFGLVVMRLSGLKFKLPQAKKAEEKIEAIEEVEGKVLRVWVGFVILVSINALFFYIIPEENWWAVSSWIARAATGAAFASWMKYSYFSSKSQRNKANSFKFLAQAATVMAVIFVGISIWDNGGARTYDRTDSKSDVNASTQKVKSTSTSKEIGFLHKCVEVPAKSEGKWSEWLDIPPPEYYTKWVARFEAEDEEEGFIGVWVKDIRGNIRKLMKDDRNYLGDAVADPVFQYRSINEAKCKMCLYLKRISL